MQQKSSVLHEMLLTCWKVKRVHFSLTGGVVILSFILFRAISAQKGLDVLVLVPVKRGDAVHAVLRVATDDPTEGTEALQWSL